MGEDDQKLFSFEIIVLKRKSNNYYSFKLYELEAAPGEKLNFHGMQN